MASVTVKCNGDGTFTLRVTGLSGPGTLWGRYYMGVTNPIPSPAPNPFPSDGGTAAWTQHSYTSVTDLTITVTPPAGQGVNLIVWDIQDDSATFSQNSSGFEPPCTSSSSSSSSSTNSSSSNSSSSSSYNSSSSNSSSSSLSSSSSDSSSPSDSSSSSN